MQNKKCGIATITVGANYGNRLQNYALQRVLKNLDIDSETIQYEPRYFDEVKNNVNILKKLNKNFKIGLKPVLQKVYRRINKNKFNKKEDERFYKFEEFKKNNIKFSEKKYNYDSNLKELNEEYDFFITGSDQVWNPGYEGMNEFYYLNFANFDRTIAYAPSFGVSNIPEEKKEFYIRMLNNIKYLSVREEKGKEIIKELTEKNAIVVLDPTLLLDKKEWQKVSKKINYKEKYIATYFLGILTSDKRKIIEKFAKEHNYKIIDIYDRNNINSIFAGPSEFLGIIENSEYVFTDSFHGTVFSIIFEKPFTVFERYSEIKSKSMNSRIESILRLLKLEKCQQVVNKNGIDYNIVKEILSEKKKESIEFLQNSIEEIDKNVGGKI